MEKAEFYQKEHFSFDDLRTLVTFLRSPEGCPWDREQTHESIRNHFVEEAYEVCEGIDQKDDALLCEELGDVLFQVLFHTDIARQEGRFDVQEVLDGICKKMILRHPQLFLEGAEAISWEEIKKKEKGEKSLHDTLSRISSALPALKRAEKFLEKGADFSALSQVSPTDEIGAALAETVVKARALGIDPEEALNKTLAKALEKCTNCE